MDRKLYLKDIDIECDLMVYGKSEEEVIAKASEHGQTMHRLKGFSKKLYDEARSAIHDGYCDSGNAEEVISGECNVCYEDSYDCVDECCC